MKGLVYIHAGRFKILRFFRLSCSYWRCFASL